MGDGGDGNGEDGNGVDGGDGDGMGDGGDGGDMSREELRHSGGRRSANRKASCPPAKFGGVTDRGFTFPHLHHFASARRSRLFLILLLIIFLFPLLPILSHWRRDFGPQSGLVSPRSMTASY